MAVGMIGSRGGVQLRMRGGRADNREGEKQPWCGNEAINEQSVACGDGGKYAGYGCACLILGREGAGGFPSPIRTQSSSTDVSTIPIRRPNRP